MGEMLEKNKSLMHIDVLGECSLIIPSSSVMNVMLFGGGCSPEESECSLWVGY
jgi:hypothetical protein